MVDAASQSPADLLEAFFDAFNRHDADAVVACMTENCVFEAAGGPEAYGTRFEGRDAARAAFNQVWKTFPDAHWSTGRRVIAGEFALAEWRFSGTREDGARLEADGCDLLTLRDGKIAIKKAFRKERALLQPGKA